MSARRQMIRAFAKRQGDGYGPGGNQPYRPPSSSRPSGGPGGEALHQWVRTDNAELGRRRRGQQSQAPFAPRVIRQTPAQYNRSKVRPA